jgi:hypothetical protein
MPNVDILVVNRNTLPFLRLLVAQVDRLKPATPCAIWVCDNCSNDGTREWLARAMSHQWITGFCCGSRPDSSHTEGLNILLAATSSPLVCLMDVDSVPVRAGWLEDAIERLEEGVGAVGLSQAAKTPQYQGDAARRDGFRTYVHPSFCVLRRETLSKYDVSPGAVMGNASGFYDVCEYMCKVLEEKGLRLEFTGKAYAAPDDLACKNQKVLHLYGSTQVLADPWMPVTSDQRTFMMRQAAQRHRQLLEREGLWVEFMRYVRDSEPRNPLCARYGIL